MSALTIYHESSADKILFKTRDPLLITEKLNQVGVNFEQWPTYESIGLNSTHEQILCAYENQIKNLVNEQGFQSWDVVALHPDNPNKVSLREKFLSEHTHSEDEVRFFVSGKGLFTLHIDDKVYSVLCERGDFISVPAKVRHWFDMGPCPHFIAIRLFNNPDGWIAQYSGDDISNRFPKVLEEEKMSDALKLCRQELLSVKAFDTTRDGFESGILLDANESPWNNKLNRYIDSMTDASILASLSRFYQVDSSQILLTRGSCEGIDLLVRAFCQAYQDAVLVCPPTFSIFAQCAAIQGAKLISVPLQKENNFALDVQTLLNSVTANTKLVFICTPNNPTGNLIPMDDILKIVKALQGKAMVIVDEAYIEFSHGISAATLINEFSNVVVLRTLSKAFGLAGIRCGVLLSQNPLIKVLTAMMLPFPLSILTTEAVKEALTSDKMANTQKQIAYIRQQREKVKKALQALPIVKQVWDSQGNFLFVKFNNIHAVMRACKENTILVRHFIGIKEYENCLRISIGLEEQNQILINVLKELSFSKEAVV